MPQLDPQWEENCLDRARRGERDAFAELYRAFAPAVYARLLALLGERSAAEDALGETFRAALESLSRFESRGKSIFSWLLTIARNKALDMHRARQRAGRALCSFETLLEHLPRPSLEDHLQVAEEMELRRRAVVEALGRLNARYREAIELRFFEGLGRQECAASLGLQLGTFDVLLLRALRAFRREWEKKE